MKPTDMYPIWCDPWYHFPLATLITAKFYRRIVVIWVEKNLQQNQAYISWDIFILYACPFPLKHRWALHYIMLINYPWIIYCKNRSMCLRYIFFNLDIPIKELQLLSRYTCMYSISQEICTRFLLCCALLWLYIDWLSHIHQAYFTGTVAI